ncbi:hypothetical protein HYDPIDRAFT_34687 [Hydnomerulius pinastri MD-312]|uniref:Uncharacterized protein n=1 Tax=Hydnomerulius pinastri MD-312 TaxID=994086 RepID=A0A0C9VK90_9AGAM|nr:hypothetical protein HYDPIDRAFT_34687 [Hydnomerulius pinastri MD-312]
MTVEYQIVHPSILPLAHTRHRAQSPSRRSTFPIRRFSRYHDSEALGDAIPLNQTTNRNASPCQSPQDSPPNGGSDAEADNGGISEHPAASPGDLNVKVIPISASGVKRYERDIRLPTNNKIEKIPANKTSFVE